MLAEGVATVAVAPLNVASSGRGLGAGVVLQDAAVKVAAGDDEMVALEVEAVPARRLTSLTG